MQTKHNGYDALINGFLAKIREVQAISNKTNLLAINASIETIHASDLLASFEHIVTLNLMTQAKIIGVMVESDSDFQKKDGVALANECGIDEFHVTDDQGIICLTNIPDAENTLVASEEILQILKDPSLEISLPATINRLNNQLFKTVAIARRDQGGIIQIGTHFQRPSGQLAIDGFGVVAQEAKRLADISKDISAKTTASAYELRDAIASINELTNALTENPGTETAAGLIKKLAEMEILLKNILSPLKELFNIARQINLLGVRAAIEAAHSTNDKQDFDSLLNKHMLIEARLAATMIESNPKLDSNDIKDFCAATGVGELWITDAGGKVEITNVTGGEGFIFQNEGQTAPYLKLLTNPDLVVTVPPSRRALDDKVFKYIGISRKGSPGIFQIGNPSKLHGENTAEGFSVVATQIKVLSEQTKIITAEMESSVVEMNRITSEAVKQTQAIEKSLSGRE